MRLVMTRAMRIVEGVLDDPHDPHDPTVAVAAAVVIARVNRREVRAIGQGLLALEHEVPGLDARVTGTPG